MTDEPGDSPLEPRWPLLLQTTRDATCTDCGTACEAGFEALYRAYSAPLLRFVRRCAAERGLPEAQLDAADVVHDTFERMLFDLDTISNPPAWLYTVARRRVARIHADQRRHAHGDPDHHIDGDSADVRWTSLAPRAAVEDVIAARAVMDAIAHLPDRQRTATYLRQVEGWSLNEIGGYLNCASATAGVHVHRGTRAVAEVLVERDFDLRDAWAGGGASRVPAIALRLVLMVMALAAAMVVMAVTGGLLYWLGAPLWLVIAGSSASVVLVLTGDRLWNWRDQRRFSQWAMRDYPGRDPSVEHRPPADRDSPRRLRARPRR